MSVSYSVPGTKAVIAQDGPMTCWATVYTMMLTWKSSYQRGIRESVGSVDNKYAVYYDNGLKKNPNPQGLPSAEFGPFLRAARMSHQPMANLRIDDWVELLKKHGLLWVGTLNVVGPGGGLHSRIIEGISGGGIATDTNFAIIDPDGGRQYNERFDNFVAKYEGGFAMAQGEYLQIRHFD